MDRTMYRNTKKKISKMLRLVSKKASEKYEFPTLITTTKNGDMTYHPLCCTKEYYIDVQKQFERVWYGDLRFYIDLTDDINLYVRDEFKSLTYFKCILKCICSLMKADESDKDGPILMYERFLVNDTEYKLYSESIDDIINNVRMKAWNKKNWKPIIDIIYENDKAYTKDIQK